MNVKAVRIVDLGRGPQIEGHRLTVLDVFYYVHRGYDFDFIHRAMPSLTASNSMPSSNMSTNTAPELVEKDRRVDEFHKRGMEEQHARGGIFAENGENLTTDQRLARLKEKMALRLAEKNGAHYSD